MTHLSEERNIIASPAAIWRVVADTTRWPQFYATPKERGKLRSVEYLDGATTDGPGVKRRLHFLGIPSWDEQVSRWKPDEHLAWLGIRNPWQKYWQQQMEIIPGKGFATLRWDVFFSLDAPVGKKVFKNAMEDIMLSSLERIERLAAADEAREPQRGR